MRYLLLLLTLLLTLGTITPSAAQILDPVQWQTTVEEGSSPDERIIVFKATIDPDWYLYSSDFDPDLGPQVTTFIYEDEEGYQLSGEVIPVDPKEKFDEIFEGNVTYFKQTGVFRQPVKLTGKDDPVATGIIEYQTCSDITGQCIPKEYEFSVALTGENTLLAGTTNPEKGNAQTSSESSGSVFSAMNNDSTTPANDTENPEKSVIATGQPEKNEAEKKESLWSFLLIAFLAGMAVLITPCVFPILPMTLSMFSGDKKGGHTKALFYGLSIVVIYTVAGTLVAGLLGADANNEISTHWLPNTIFFLTFLIFALSFFGLFEITLPSGLVNKIDDQADKGGLIGVFFMALTLVVVSFSCTGPIVGSLLVASASGDILQPVAGMFSFGLGMALPLTVLAFSPGVVDKFIRGQSGSWLNAVKVVFGFLELALAFKFLSMIDLVYHWGILDRDVFLVIWIVIFSLMGFYLLGKIRLASDGPNEGIGVGRLLLSIITFAFVLYLIPGLFGAPLKAIAGYLPPMSTQDFNIVRLMREQSAVGEQVSVVEEEACESPKYNDFLEIPQGLFGYFEYEQALACSKATGKPVFLDFTGHGCANCREMEESVWSDPEVLQSLREDYIVVSLYVDERYELPESEWYESAYDGKVKKTIGKQNADFQITRFGNNAQPFYVLVDSQGQPLTNEPMGYNKDVEAFKDFLESGLEAHENNKVAAVQ
ncbi:protein-disulfide reductase DsbD family protein [Roseivirga sp. BDSF3-8]|uniref:protein-disulfide reductase DsbD family protein n=1 Tax=Roseivirga sp. BDSF3-8 TaxID=3241598 RepID=UPI00353191D5